MAKYLLGTDNGGTISKAGLFTPDGKEIAVASRKTDLLTPNPGWSERNMDDIWKGTAESIKEVVEKSGVSTEDIACVACTGHGNGLYLVDEHGNSVRNAIMSMDGRASDIIKKWTADGVDKAIRPKTMQCIWSAQPNALLAWLRDNEPKSIEKTKWVFMCKDFIRFKLTNQAYAELTDMSGTSLMNVGTAEYDMDVLEAFGIPEMRDMLPPLKLSADICGYITAEAAALTGLKEGTPVAGGMFDVDACGLACSIVDESQLCMVMGTWGNNQYISKTPITDDAVFMTSRYSIDDYYLMLEGSATSASNLEWFVSEFFKAERILSEQKGKSVYDICNDLVESTKPTDANIVFLPFIFGSNVGYDAKSCIIGIRDWHNRGHILRAIYEGVVFSHYWHVEKLLKYRPMPTKIMLTGGASHSNVWVQMVADCFGVPVEIPDGTELGTLGAAIAAGVAVGCFENYNQAIKSMVSFSRCQKPEPGMRDIYMTKYKNYKKVIKALEPIWNDIS